MIPSNQNEFEEALKELVLNFEKAADGSDGDIASDLVDLCLKWERLRKGVDDVSRAARIVDVETLKKMAEWDSDDPVLQVAEKVLRRLATARGVDGIVLLRKAVEQKRAALSREQARIAKTPRPAHPIDQLIRAQIKARPGISASELIDHLERTCPNALIVSIEDDEVIFQDIKLKPLKLSGLPMRLSRIKNS